MKKPPNTQPPKMRLYRFRSAITGKFVSAWYALRHPKTTVKERREK